MHLCDIAMHVPNDPRAAIANVRGEKAQGDTLRGYPYAIGLETVK